MAQESKKAARQYQRNYPLVDVPFPGQHEEHHGDENPRARGKPVETVDEVDGVCDDENPEDCDRQAQSAE